MANSKPVLRVRISTIQILGLPEKEEGKKSKPFPIDLGEMVHRGLPCFSCPQQEEEKEEKEEEEEKEASHKHHHREPTYVPTRFGEKQVCPHCGVYLEEKNTYTDKKGWVFCRSCFRKGRGAVCIRKQAATELVPVTLLDYTLPAGEEFTLEGFDKQANPAIANRPTIQVSPLSANRANAGAVEAGKQQPFVPEEPSSLLPWLGLPALGAVGGGLLHQDSKPDEPERTFSNSLAQGALTGLGAAGGQAVAGAVTQGDVGSRLLGAGGGGLLAYLLARAALEPGA